MKLTAVDHQIAEDEFEERIVLVNEQDTIVKTVAIMVDTKYTEQFCESPELQARITELKQAAREVVKQYRDGRVTSQTSEAVNELATLLQGKPE